MNSNHAQVCTSPEWAEHIQQDILPALTRDISLGEEMLEIGPGPGAATEWLRSRVRQLTAVEIDAEAAGKLAARYPGGNVEVVTGDATQLSYPDGSFDSVACFTMLHHVPTAARQDQILAEALRVLRPGGTLIGSDSLASVSLHHFHEGDPYNPVDPAWLLGRLQTLGFGAVTVTVDSTVKFAARKTTPADADDCADDGPVTASR